MGRLFNLIHDCVNNERYIIGQHAAGRLEECDILEWQAAAGLAESILMIERPHATPNPVMEVRETLPDGTEFKAVWSFLAQSGVAKLVTVHFFNHR